MTKVAILIKDLSNLGGLEKDSWYCALSFARLGCDVTLLTTGKPTSGPWPMHESISIQSLGERPFLSVRHIRQFDKRARQWLSHHPHDITFGLDQNTELNFLRAGNGSHAMALEQRSIFEGPLKRLSFHFNPLHQTLLSFEKKLLKSDHLKQIFTNSHMIRDDLIQRYDIPGDKIDVVYNGVEWKAYTKPFENFEKERPEILKKEALHDNNLQLLFVGSGFARKGLLPLLKALIPFKFEPIELVVLGKDKNLKFYEDFCLKAGIASKVRFMGPRSATPFYQVADWCCIPSFYDPCANVTLESLAMGVPVISSKFNGGFELIDENNGLIIEDLLDTEAFSNQIAKALKRRKTMENAKLIREKMRAFEFENQFAEMASRCLEKI
jgi:UDP-glucose:(heptosyl)LPS alpha-1,3-glucosyltransferase